MKILKKMYKQVHENRIPDADITYWISVF